MQNKKAFSFIELLIVVTILSVISVVAYSVHISLKQNSINARIESELATAKNALSLYEKDRGELPLPGGNKNFFSATGSYRHEDFSSGATFGVYGKLTEDILPKMYLDSTPLDPRNNNYFAYGRTNKGGEFEIAGVIGDGENFTAKIEGNYKAENGPKSLIREYNGADFIEDGKGRLPYNPYAKILTATDQNGKIYKEGDTVKAESGDITLYFSDGSTSLLENGGELVLTKANFPKENDLVSKIELTLNAGVLWTKATRLLGGEGQEDDSEFNVVMQDSTAAVRGTIFRATAGGNVEVYAGEVDIIRGRSASSAPQSSGTIPVFGDTKKIPPVVVNITTEEIKNKEIPLEVTSSDCVFGGKVYKNGESFSGATEKLDGKCSIETLICGTTNKQDTMRKKGVIYIKNKGPNQEKTIITKNTSCCIKDEQGECMVADNELRKIGYELVAAAMYDTPGDINMITSYGTKLPFEEQRVITNKSDSSSKICQDNNKLIKKYSFCIINNIKGIFIDRGRFVSDKLEYKIKDLNLGKYFAIEMNIRGKILTNSINDTENKYYLFSTGNQEDNDKPRISVYMQDGNLTLAMEKKSDLQRITSIGPNEIKQLNIKNDNFYKITALFEGNFGYITLEGVQSNKPKNLDINDIMLDQLYIGSDSKASNHINNVIDYVKIYKKDIVSLVKNELKRKDIPYETYCENEKVQTCYEHIKRNPNFSLDTLQEDTKTKLNIAPFKADCSNITDINEAKVGGCAPF